MQNQPSVLQRFMNYIKFDTQSCLTSQETPSTAKQLKLAEFLVHELQGLGIENAHMTPEGVVYATIEATPGHEHCPAIGFIAHMDTSPDASDSADKKPQVIHYEGGDVLLNKEQNIVFSTQDFPEIEKYAGQDIVFTDGTTLLGADDKAGIAEIIEMASWVMAHPEVPHAKLCLAFTPDEEVARGTENFDIEHFGAQYAYTFDGDDVGVLESENFNGGTAHVTIHGVGVHPGLAKDKMINSIRLMAKFIDMLPAVVSPECTEDREGFMHPNAMTGSCVKSYVKIIVRDHDRTQYELKKKYLAKTVELFNKIYGEGRCELRYVDSYENMRQYIEKAPKVLDIVREVYRDCGLEPIEKPVRGGTDGARLSARGLPCPNIFTGGSNFHGVYEFIPVASMVKASEIAIGLAKKSATIDSLS